MRTLAAIMASITLVTTALFAHALAAADEQPAPTVVRIASR
jgi:Spy/CpxP family protein refolding chaperone